MQRTLVKRTLLVAATSLLLSACPASGDDGPGADTKRCALDPAACPADQSGDSNDPTLDK